MSFKEILDNLKNDIKSKINADTPKEQLDAYQKQNENLDSLEKEYDRVVSENVKYKDTIVNMVLTSGDGKKPTEEIEDKALSIDECLQQIQEKEKDKKWNYHLHN